MYHHLIKIAKEVKRVLFLAKRPYNYNPAKLAITIIIPRPNVVFPPV